MHFAQITDRPRECGCILRLRGRTSGPFAAPTGSESRWSRAFRPSCCVETILTPPGKSTVGPQRKLRRALAHGLAALACGDSRRRGRDLGPAVARLHRFPHLQQELLLPVIALPPPGMIKLDEMGLAPLRECTPFLGCLVEGQGRTPVRHESHRESDCDGVSSRQRVYEGLTINARGLGASRGLKQVRIARYLSLERSIGGVYANS